MIVTIDGPAGTGKSTVARMLAEQLGFELLNTGAMYRAVTYVCLQRRLDLNDEQMIGNVAKSLPIQFANNRLLLGDDDVTDSIRGQAVTQSVPIVAANRTVRARLVELQRQIGRSTNLVTEGRDQGTVVFPNAECKFFLTAQASERARRRQSQLSEKGEFIPLAELIAQQQVRDRQDETRECSPLRPAADSYQVDTSNMTLQDVTKYLLQLINRTGHVASARTDGMLETQ